MPKPFVPDYQRKTIPLVPMIAISCVSFLDNFCYSLVNPIIPYMTLEYLPDACFCRIFSSVGPCHPNRLLQWMDYGCILPWWYPRKLFLGLVCGSIRQAAVHFVQYYRSHYRYQHFWTGTRLLDRLHWQSPVGFPEWQSGHRQDLHQ